MAAYILRRLLLGIPTVLGVLFIIFVLFFAVASPQNMALRTLGDKATSEQVDTWIHDHGYHLPMFWDSSAEGIAVITETRLYQHYRRMLTFDFGRSDLDDIQIITKLKKGMLPSLALALPSFFLSVVLSIGFSLFLSFFHETYIDKTGVILCVLGMSTVIFIYIIGGQFLFGKVLKWFPISGWHPRYMVHFIFLPVLISIVAGLGQNIRFYRTLMVHELHQDYIRTARAKGLSDTVMMIKHLLKNAMIPILTQVVMAIPFLFIGSLLVESFFSIPGLGKLTVEAIQNNDFRTVSAMVYIGAMLYIAGNILTDISYTFVDPRVRVR